MDASQMDLSFVIGVMIVIAALFAIVAKRLDQPLLIGYVLAGFIIGPSVLGVVSDPGFVMALFAEFGLVLLLFMIGLELDFKKIQSLGKMSIIIGTVQITIIVGVVALAAIALGFNMITSVYTGLVVAFSSTIVVAKALTDKGELNTLHGGMILGIVIVEDILAVVGLTLLGALVPSSGGSHGFTFTHMIELVGMHLPEAAWFSMVMLAINGALFVGVAYLFTRYVLPKVLFAIGSSTELLIAVAFGFALTLSAAGAFFSFSLSIGAFVGGIALSNSHFNHELLGKIRPIKDFFIILFFVALGTLLTFSNFVDQLLLIVFLLIAVMLAKPVIIFWVRKAFRYTNRISFLVSVALAQISEFSLILAMAGVAQGSLPQEYLTGAVIATLISMMATAYIIRYDEQLYHLTRPLIDPIERIFGLRPDEVHHAHEMYAPEVLVVGINALSVEAIETARGKKKTVVIEKDPAKIASLHERGVTVLCVDAYNQDLFEELLDISKADMVVSAVSDLNLNLYFVKKVREHNKKASIIVMANEAGAGRKLYSAGATVVLIPEAIGRRLLHEIMISNENEFDKLRALYSKELHKNFVYKREL